MLGGIRLSDWMTQEGGVPSADLRRLRGQSDSGYWTSVWRCKNTSLNSWENSRSELDVWEPQPVVGNRATGEMHLGREVSQGLKTGNRRQEAAGLRRMEGPCCPLQQISGVLRRHWVKWHEEATPGWNHELAGNLDESSFCGVAGGRGRWHFEAPWVEECCHRAWRDDR